MNVCFWGKFFKNKIIPAFWAALFHIERSHCFTSQTILPLGRGSQEQGNSLLKGQQQHSHACSPFLWLPQLEIKQKKWVMQTCGQVSKLVDCTSLTCLKSNCAFFHSIFNCLINVGVWIFMNIHSDTALLLSSPPQLLKHCLCFYFSVQFWD